MSKHRSKTISVDKASSVTNIGQKKPDIGFLFIGAYLLLHFIPNLDAVDVIGPQWLAFSLLNILATTYLLIRVNTYSKLISGLSRLLLTLVYLAFFVWGAFSYFYALNKPEVLVAAPRIFNTLVAFINIAALVYLNKNNFIYAAYLIVLILFFESLSTLRTFFAGLYEINFDELVLSLKGNTGNKNIMAAAIAIKIPFLLFVLTLEDKFKKIFSPFVLFMAFFSLAILNARTTYVSTISLIILFSIYQIYAYRIKWVSSNVITFNMLGVIIPLFLAIIFSQLVVENAIDAQGGSSGYGTITERIETVGTSDESSGRTGFWRPTIAYIQDHTLLGGGLGNWKVYSIPFVRETTNELIVPYHSHNDFLEMAADLGLPGGFLFALLFLIPIIYVFKIWRQNEVSLDLKTISIFSLFALSVYFFDAFLNFPMERPATQILFAFILSAVSMSYLHSKEGEVALSKSWIPKLYLAVTLIILIPSSYFTFLTYKSMKGQMILMRETNTEAKEPLENIANIFPPVPNISVTTLPIQSMKARYYMRDKRYDEAIKLLDEGSKANPYIYYSEFLKAALYFSINKVDSAYKYGKMSFYNWPRASNYFRNYIAILGRMKDTAEIKNAFATYVKYRNESFAWNTYLMGMLQSKGRGNPQLLMMADSALKLFPSDSTLLQRRKEIIGTFSNSGATVSEDVIQKANVFYQEGAQLFSKQSYEAAAQKFIKAALLTPGNYAFYENAGLCFYANQQFEKAIQQFNRAITLGTSTTGKSEYFKGVSLVNLGKKEEGCSFVNIARSKNYPEAEVFLKTNCK